MRLEAHQQPLNLNTKEEEKDKWINTQGTKWYRDKNIDLIQAYDNRVNLAKHDRKHLAAWNMMIVINFDNNYTLLNSYIKAHA